MCDELACTDRDALFHKLTSGDAWLEDIESLHRYNQIQASMIADLEAEEDDLDSELAKLDAEIDGMKERDDLLEDDIPVETVSLHEE